MFLDIYLEVETPKELVKRLFLSFVKVPTSVSPQFAIYERNLHRISSSLSDTGKLLKVLKCYSKE